MIDAGDVKLYTEIGRIFKDTTGQKRAPKESTAGSFHAWLYAQRGIPSFATVVWGRPDPKPEDGEEGEGAGADAAEPAPAADEDVDPISGTWSGDRWCPRWARSR